ncbi:hypothetical protein BH23ACT9_BH23ACT9_28270 [soil metagenome]
MQEQTTAQKLQALAALRDSGALTEAEHQQAVARLMAGPTAPAGLPSTTPREPASGDPQATHVFPPTADGGPPTSAQPLQTAPPTGGSRRRPLLLALGAVVVVAVGAAAAYAFSLYSLVNGSRSPEAAVAQMLDGLTAQDPLAVFGTVVPAERRNLGDVAQRVISLLDGVDLPGLDDQSGFTIDTSAIELDVTELADDVAMVSLRGQLTVEVDLDAVSPDVRAALRDTELADGRETIDLRDRDLFGQGDLDELFLIAVDDGSGWYVSPLLTIFEIGSQVEGLRGGDFLAYGDIPDSGAASPVEAVEQLIEALESGRFDDIAGALAPGETAAYRIYERTLFDEIGRGGYPDDARVRMDDLVLSADGDVVTVESVRVQYDDGFDSIELELEGDCIRITERSSTQRDCLDDVVRGSSDLWLADLAAGLSGGVQLVAVREHGGWYVSPVATLGHIAVRALSEVTTGGLLAMLEIPHLTPPALTVTGTQTVQGDLSDDGYYDVLELAPSEDQVMAVCADDALRLRHMIDGTTASSRSGSIVMSLDVRDGNRLLVVPTDVRDAGPYEAAVQVVPADGEATAGLPATIELDGQGCGIQTISVDLEEGEGLAVDADGASVHVVSPRQEVNQVGEVFTADRSGVWTIVVSGIARATVRVDESATGVLFDDRRFVGSDGISILIDVGTSGELVVTVDALPGSSLDPTVELIDPFGFGIGYDDDGGDGFNSRLLERVGTGQHELLIAPFASDSAGDAQITVTLQ